MVRLSRGDQLAWVARRMPLNVAALVALALNDKQVTSTAKRVMIHLAAIMYRSPKSIVTRLPDSEKPEAMVDACKGPARDLARLGGVWISLGLWERAREMTDNFTTSNPDAWQIPGEATLDPNRCQEAWDVVVGITMMFAHDLRDFDVGMRLSRECSYRIDKCVMFAFWESMIVAMEQDGRVVPVHLVSFNRMRDDFSCHPLSQTEMTLMRHADGDGELFFGFKPWMWENEEGDIMIDEFTRIPARSVARFVKNWGPCSNLRLVFHGR